MPSSLLVHYIIMTKLLMYCSGLNNDPVPETFSLHFQQKQDVFPCQYIKIGETTNNWSANNSIIV